MRPDAAKIPDSLVERLPDDDERKRAVCELAEELLGVDPDGLDLVWCRAQRGFYFCSTDPAAHLFHKPDHPTKAGLPRYRWEAHPSGAELGYIDVDDEA